MNELGHFIKVENDIRKIKIRGLIEGTFVEVNMPCPFNYATCTEDCLLLKFEQINDGYEQNEFDVTFGCIDNMFCSMIEE